MVEFECSVERVRMLINTWSFCSCSFTLSFGSQTLATCEIFHNDPCNKHIIYMYMRKAYINNVISTLLIIFT